MKLLVEEHEIVIDDDDFTKLHRVRFSSGIYWEGTIADVSWRVKHRSHTKYAVSTLGAKLELRLHRVVVDATEDVIVDHIDGNGLNCSRSNLRIATAAENARNRRKIHVASSRFKGVCWHSQARKWAAHIRHNGYKVYLGVFDTEVEAAKAYNAAAVRLHADFASLNAV